MEVKKILKKINLKPSKILGQNFFINSDEASLIIEKWKLDLKDNILEIGPGLGAFTNELISKVNKLNLVEKDLKLTNFLKIKFSNHSKIKIFNEDILNFNLKMIPYKKPFKVISNLPFSSATKILQWCFKNKNHFTFLYLSFAEDVAKKILNTKKSNFFNLLCQSHSTFEKVNLIKPKAFFPRPKINTIFIVFKLNYQDSVFENIDFKNFVSLIFRNKRKTLTNNLKSASYELKNIKKFLEIKNIALNVRAEDLNLTTIKDCYKFLNK